MTLRDVAEKLSADALHALTARCVLDLIRPRRTLLDLVPGPKAVRLTDTRLVVYARTSRSFWHTTTV